MDQQKIGAFIRELRIQQGMNQKQLAEKINVSPTTISKWESGINIPDYANLQILSDFFGVSLSELLNGEMTTVMEVDASGLQLGNEEIDEKEQESFTCTKKITNIKMRKMVGVSALLLIITFVCSFAIWYYNFAPARYTVVHSYYDEPEEIYSSYNFDQIYRIIVEYDGKIESDKLYEQALKFAQMFSDKLSDADALFIEYYKHYDEDASYDHFSKLYLPLKGVNEN